MSQVGISCGFSIPNCIFGCCPANLKYIKSSTRKVQVPMCQQPGSHVILENCAKASFNESYYCIYGHSPNPKGLVPLASGSLIIALIIIGLGLKTKKVESMYCSPQVLRRPSRTHPNPCHLYCSTRWRYSTF